MSLAVWSDRPLGVKLSAVVAAGAVSLGVFAVIAVGEITGTGGPKAALLASTTATGAALEADMMHDAVRADVLQALLDGRGPRYDSAVTDLGEHSDNFHATLTEVTEAGLGSDVGAAVEDVTPAVDAYLADRKSVV